MTIHMHPLTILNLTFDLPMYPRKIHLWRGAVVEHVGRDKDLFHNHDNGQDQQRSNQKFHYRYPLIQYRSRNGKAQIHGLTQGADALRQWIESSPKTIRISGRKYPLQLANYQEDEFPLQITEEVHTYRLMDWMPLNQDNYQRWLQMDRLTQRVALLEEILAGHLLAFASGVDWTLPRRFDAYLLTIKGIRNVYWHGHNRLAFNVLFKTNLLLPPGIALGRAVSHGFGVTHPVKNRSF